MPKANEGGYVAWAENLHRVMYNSKMILLAECRNDFIFFDTDQTAFVSTVLGKHASQLDSEAEKLVDELIGLEILTLAQVPDFSKKFSDIKTSIGTARCAWQGGRDGWVLSSIRLHTLLKAMKYLKHAKCESQVGHLQGLLDHLRKSVPTVPLTNQARLISLGSNINLAIKLLNTEVKCLEFAYCLASMAFEENLSCSFCIGVQSYPFISHAWVRGPEGVVLDSDELEKDLALMVVIGATS
ncbi:lasso peptide biosynthesis B2 protein [Pseudomonas sp. GZD-222]|uniref:lasso peptide biosynthesis B2 protein n=1 Tax=Pseudomonas sp. GZD-222 TaxID=3404805 RepID=UPI003BB58BB9